jgi:hypothetical protein
MVNQHADGWRIRWTKVQWSQLLQGDRFPVPLAKTQKGEQKNA